MNQEQLLQVQQLLAHVLSGDNAVRKQASDNIEKQFDLNRDAIVLAFITLLRKSPQVHKFLIWVPLSSSMLMLAWINLFVSFVVNPGANPVVDRRHPPPQAAKL